MVMSHSMKTTNEKDFLEKAKEINLVLSQPDVDLWRLRELALSEGGLVDDTLRRSAWPKLVGLHDRLFTQERKDDARASLVADGRSLRSSRRRQLPPSRPPADHRSEDVSIASSVASTRDKIIAVSDDFDQIERDVARCTWHLLSGTQRSIGLQMEHKRHRKIRKVIRRKQRRLANLINLTLQQSYPFRLGDKKLNYYQGYHDVACIVLSTLGGRRPVAARDSSNLAASMGLDLPAAVLLQLSQSHLCDYMKANFRQFQTALRLSFFPLLCYFDRDVHAHLCECEMEPFFCLSWIITWFSHDVRDTVLVKRLFDFFLVSHPLMPIYVSLAMITHPVNRQLVLETECDFSLVHQTLQRLPRNSSMVGWKYRPGDGYVSDDEEEDDEEDDDLFDGSSQTTLDADLASIMESNKENSKETQPPPEAVSIESSYLSSPWTNARVPFQDLLDRAVQYMQIVPPRKLLPLAESYYGLDQVDSMLVEAPDISLLEAVPDWATASSAKADWVLKQAQKNKSAENIEKDNEDATAVARYLKDHANSPAVIAAGFGTGDRRHKRRRWMIVAAVAVAALAVWVQSKQQGQQLLLGEPFKPTASCTTSIPANSRSRPALSRDSRPERMKHENASRNPHLKNSSAKPKAPADSFKKESKLSVGSKVSDEQNHEDERKKEPKGSGTADSRRLPPLVSRGSAIHGTHSAGKSDASLGPSHGDVETNKALHTAEESHDDFTENMALSLHTRPRWITFFVTFRRASLKRATNLAKQIIPWNLQRRHEALNGISLRVFEDIGQQLFLRFANAVVEQQRQLAIYLKNTPVLHELGSELRRQVGKGALIVQARMQPQLQRIAKYPGHLMKTIRSRKEYIMLLKLARGLSKQLSRRQIKDEKTPDNWRSRRQPRIRSVSRASLHIHQVVEEDAVLGTLDEVTSCVQLLSAFEKLLIVVEQVESFPLVHAILKVLRKMYATQLAAKLSVLVEELEHSPF